MFSNYFESNLYYITYNKYKQIFGKCLQTKIQERYIL